MRKYYYRIIFLLIGIFFATAEYSDDTKSCPAINIQNEEESMQPTTAELIKDLTDSCRYDPQRPPPTENDEPVRVYVKVYFYFLKSYEAHNLQFTVYMLLQCRFKDQRLSFDPEVYNVTEIVGTKEVSQLLWMPHVYFHNERHSMVMGPGESDVMTHIIHDGTVLYTKRIHTTLFCWMKLQKFPFDSQECTLILDSWSYNMSYLTLEWEDDYPVHCRDQLTLTEFSLIGEPIATEGTDNFDFDQDASGDFQGNYSSLVVTFHLQRESGFYIYDYFIPSILLVVVSWVSFWLEADALPGRVTLGSSTMLTFIILALQTGNSLPKVSYVKASEIWFLGCTGFIFGSLVEFAFVNTIWRSRRKKIQLKKVNSKYILKQTLTPKAKRKDIFLERSTSCPYDMNTAWGDYLTRDTLQTSSLGVGLHKTSLPNVNIESVETVEMAISNENSEKSGKSEETLKRSITDIFRRSKREKEFTEPTLMTPKEVSNWIDNRSRVVFPISFLIFNVIYWSYVYYF